MTTMKDKKFEQLLRRKLDGLETPPPPDVWERIEAALPAQHIHGTVPGTPRSFRLRPWLWTSAGAVAAACALVLVFHRGAVNDASMLAIAGDSLSPANVSARPVGGMMPESASAISRVRSLPSDGREMNVSAKGQGTFGKVQKEVHEIVTAHTQRQNEMTEETLLQDRMVALENTETYSETGTEGGETLPDATTDHETTYRVLSSGSKSAFSSARGKSRMVASAGSSGRANRFREGVSGQVWVSGNTFGRQTNNVPNLRVYNEALQSPEDGMVAEPLQNSVATGNVREKHLPPFQFGLDVCFPIAPRLALETGLSYSILASTFEQALPPAVTHQKAHFVGVPFRAVVGVYRQKAWDVYLGGGGKWEKCVAVHTDSPDGVDASRPSQWSLQVSAGVQYRISPHAACYVEPGIGYYFDNHSSLSTAYGERPVNFSLKMGIRFNLGGK